MPSPTPGERFVGLISGTSMDGIDAVVVDFSSDKPRILAARTDPFDHALRASLDAVRRDPDSFPVAQLGRVDAALGDVLAEAALNVIKAAGLRPADIEAIGSHGQTIVHHPEADPPYTLQVGDPWRLARGTGITTVADFRRADLAAGGQGAPLAPLLHDVLFRAEDETRAVVNLGGIANLTFLAPGRPVTGFDTGPANCFLDSWYRAHHAHGRFDRDGAWAGDGRVDEAWLQVLMGDPYFARPAPKSTGIEYFTPAWLEDRLPVWADKRPQDVQATLSELSARTVAEAIGGGGHTVDRLIVCGGGAANGDLVGRLQAQLGDIAVTASDDFGLPADHVESTLFAWLARQRLAGRAVATQSITGADRPVLLGAIHAA